ncbi:MAG: hypothetical protein R2819_03645 [Allomuricauda sp.]
MHPKWVEVNLHALCFTLWSWSIRTDSHPLDLNRSIALPTAVL